MHFMFVSEFVPNAEEQPPDKPLPSEPPGESPQLPTRPLPSEPASLVEGSCRPSCPSMSLENIPVSERYRTHMFYWNCKCNRVDKGWTWLRTCSFQTLVCIKILHSALDIDGGPGNELPGLIKSRELFYSLRAFK